MTEKLANGEVWINGRKTSAKLSPYICEYGFWLWNREGGFGGPHTDIHISPEDFDSYIGDGANKNLSIAIDKHDIGHIDECNGYAAVDAGSHRRRIEKLVMKVEREGAQTKFSFEGSTGLLDPRSVTGGLTSQEQQSKGISVFQIWFEIPDQELATYFKSAQALSAMTRLTGVHKS
jgi:hypothetical protein